MPPRQPQHVGRVVPRDVLLRPVPGAVGADHDVRHACFSGWSGRGRATSSARWFRALNRPCRDLVRSSLGWPVLSGNGTLVPVPTITTFGSRIRPPPPIAATHDTWRTATASGIDTGTSRARARARQAGTVPPRPAPVVAGRGRPAVDRWCVASTLGLPSPGVSMPEHAGDAGAPAGKPFSFVEPNGDTIHTQLGLRGDPQITCARRRPTRGAWVPNAARDAIRVIDVAIDTSRLG